MTTGSELIEFKGWALGDDFRTLQIRQFVANIQQWNALPLV